MNIRFLVKNCISRVFNYFYVILRQIIIELLILITSKELYIMKLLVLLL
jgi:hypothetical protein